MVRDGGARSNRACDRSPVEAFPSRCQLASALIAKERFGSLPFVTLNKDLVTAARAEGFTVLP